MDRNAQKLALFMAYCQAHPEQRFMQALRNFLGVSFVYTSDQLIEDGHAMGLRDTFYDE